MNDNYNVTFSLTRKICALITFTIAHYQSTKATHIQGKYDARTWTYKMDPKQVFLPTKRQTKQAFCQFLLP